MGKAAGMELTEEQKQRIRQEEIQRLAEEEYRARIRRELAAERATQPTVAPEPPSVPKPDATVHSPSASLQATTNRRRKAIITALKFIGLVVLSACSLLIIGRIARKAESTPDAASGRAISAPYRAQSFEEMERSLRESALRPTPMPKLTTAQIADKATPAVVVVESYNEDGERMGQGSGYVHSTDGMVVTNYHVIRGSRSLSVRIPSKGSVQVQHLLGYNIENDIAVLQLAEPVAAALEIEDFELVKVGDRVVAVGAPLGLESTVTEGIISALRDRSGTHIIQTSAALSAGSSGGPLLNEYGKVIGVSAAGVRDGQNLNFVISARHVTEVIRSKRIIGLPEMLAETQVTDRLPGSTVSVPARNYVSLKFSVTGQQGAVLVGTYSVSGGTGNDVDVSLVGSDGRVVLNSGRVKAFGQVKQRLHTGAYSLFFDNRFSTFTSKSISPDLRLVYYR